MSLGTLTRLLHQMNLESPRVRPIAPNMPTANSNQSLLPALPALPALNYPDGYFTRPDEEKALELTTAERDLLGTLEFQPALELTAAERDLLGRLVYAEAGGEGELEAAAVANSILNRWLSVREGLSPGTFNAGGEELRDIIYARGQYQPARTGKLNEPLDPKSREWVDRVIDLALNPEKFMGELEKAGKTPPEIKAIMGATGFRAHYAFSDSSQQVNTVKFGGHLFNTAGNEGMRSYVYEHYVKANSAPVTDVTKIWFEEGAYSEETPVQCQSPET